MITLIWVYNEGKQSETERNAKCTVWRDNINNLNVIAKASSERKAVITMEISDIKERPVLHWIKGKVAHSTGSIPAKFSS